MTPEELSDFKLNVDLWNYPDGSLVRKAAAHIDQQAAEVERLRSLNESLMENGNDLRTRCQKAEARIKELEAEVEAKNKQIKELQNIIDKPPEEAQWMTDYHLLRSAMDGPIIESARRWHGAFRKAQNSNLIRRQQNERLEAEVERLRSENKIISDRAAHHDRQDAKAIELLAARIAELEAGKLMYEEIAESYQIGVDDLRAYIKRLEAAFLEATKEIVYAIHEGRDAPEGEDVYAEKVAREALEQLRAEGKIGGVKTEYGGQHHCGTQIIREGSGEWHCPKCNPLLTAAQREEEGKRDA